MVDESDTTQELAAQLIRLLPPIVRADLGQICLRVEGLALKQLPDAVLLELERVIPELLFFDHRQGLVRIAFEGTREALLKALAADRASARGQTHPVRVIRAALSHGRITEALDAFDSAGGPFFAYVHGLEAAQRIVNMFPEHVRKANEQLVLCDVINAMKSGDASYAKHLLEAAFGEAAKSLTGFNNPSAFSADAAICRLVLAVADEEQVSSEAQTLLQRLIDELPPGSDMRKGMLYNVALDVFFRERQWAVAEESARRAKFHFNNANAALPMFYIDLYLTLIELARGNLAMMENRLAEARAKIESATQPTPNDLHLLAMLENIRLYELGDNKPLSQFLLREMGDETFDEVWPSIAWPLIDYGAMATASVVTLAAARAYVGRWRLQQWQSRRFNDAVNLAEIDILQLHGRWFEADERLRELTVGDISQWVEANAGRLSQLTHMAEIGLAIRCCRALLESQPHLCFLGEALALLIANPSLTARERTACLLWQCSAATQREDWETARSAMAALANLAKGTEVMAVLAEQRETLGRLYRNRDAMRILTGSARLAAFLKAHRHLADSSRAIGASDGLTRQERRMLDLLVEGLSNKLIARRLGLSVATVRFHLRNLYSKLAAGSRARAIEVAIERKLVSN